jgi:hypothetical protein
VPCVRVRDATMICLCVRVRGCGGRAGATGRDRARVRRRGARIPRYHCVHAISIAHYTTHNQCLSSVAVGAVHCSTVFYTPIFIEVWEMGAKNI